MLPPSHPVDHTPIVILQKDGAWDSERLNSEFEAIEDPSEESEGLHASKGEHPYWLYMSGQSRYDLGEVEEYLREDEQPVRFVLERLDFKRWQNVRNYQERGRHVDAQVYALRHGLKAIDNLPAGQGFKLRDGDDGPMSEGALIKLRALVGDDAFEYLGNACIGVSRELTRPEKKL